MSFKSLDQLETDLIIEYVLRVKNEKEHEKFCHNVGEIVKNYIEENYEIEVVDKEIMKVRVK